jgi:hypothetical protein
MPVACTVQVAGLTTECYTPKTRSFTSTFCNYYLLFNISSSLCLKNKNIEKKKALPKDGLFLIHFFSYCLLLEFVYQHRELFFHAYFFLLRP